jgi:hypothetical protein
MSALRSVRGGRLYWAARAIWKELFGFRFDYAAEDVPHASAPGAIAYHIDSPTLFRDAMRLDGDGVPYQVSRTFTNYNPAYVAWYGLQQLQQSELRGVPDGRASFQRQVRWLQENVVRREDGAAVWLYHFDWWEFDSFLRSGWICGMAQGLIMSVLVRAHRLQPDPGLLELARAAARPFELPVERGGVQSVGRAGPILEEYPSVVPPRVLDGTIFAMLGVHDLATESGDTEMRELFRRSVSGLLGELDEWDYHGIWSWYGRRLYLSPPHYHAANRALLTALARASEIPQFAEVARCWDPLTLSFQDRAMVYLAFLATKQRTRLRALRHSRRTDV